MIDRKRWVTCCVCLCLRSDGRVRLATLELSCLLLKQSVSSGAHCIIKDVHLACLEVHIHPKHSNCCVNTLLNTFCINHNNYSRQNESLRQEFLSINDSIL